METWNQTRRRAAFRRMLRELDRVGLHQVCLGESEGKEQEMKGNVQKEEMSAFTSTLCNWLTGGVAGIVKDVAMMLDGPGAFAPSRQHNMIHVYRGKPRLFVPQDETLFWHLVRCCIQSRQRKDQRSHLCV